MMLLTVAALFLLAPGAPTAAPPTVPRVSIVVLRDGTSYKLARPYEVRGSQARLTLVSGTLLSIRATEIDEAASKKATDEANAPPTASGTPAPTAKKTATVLTNDNLAPTGTGKGGFSVAGAPIDEETLSQLRVGQSDAARAAQDRMNRAVKDGLWTADNIQYHQGIRQGARAEWEDAAEQCRKTPGCVPLYRQDGILKTDQEVIDSIVKSGALSK